MAMDYVNLLAQQHSAQHRHIADGSGQDALIVAHLYGQVINLQAIRYVSNAAAIPVSVRQNNNLKIR